MTVRLSPAEYDKLNVGGLGFLHALMMRDKIPMRVTLKPEEKLSVEIADFNRAATLDGRLKALWFHIPNEGKRHPLVGLIMRAMGMLSGVADFCIFGHGFIEIKCGKNTLSPAQENFKKWCESLGIKWAEARSMEEYQGILKEWGAL